MSDSDNEKTTMVLTDVEGTLSRPGSVVDVLAPYVRPRLATFLDENAARPEIAVLLADAARDAGLPDLSADEAATVFEAWMDADLDVTTLLTLRAMIAEEGYRAGEIEGHVYDDAAEALSHWHAAGIETYIFTAAHAPTEKMRLQYTSHGDLSALITGWLDPNLGMPNDPNSYRLITRAMRADAADILFISTNAAAIAAAAQAGLRTVRIARPDHAPQGDTPAACDMEAESLAGIDPATVGK